MLCGPSAQDTVGATSLTLPMVCLDERRLHEDHTLTWVFDDMLIGITDKEIKRLSPLLRDEACGRRHALCSHATCSHVAALFRTWAAIRNSGVNVRRRGPSFGIADERTEERDSPISEREVSVASIEKSRACIFLCLYDSEVSVRP